MPKTHTYQKGQVLNNNSWKLGLSHLDELSRGPVFWIIVSQNERKVVTKNNFDHMMALCILEAMYDISDCAALNKPLTVARIGW